MNNKCPLCRPPADRRQAFSLSELCVVAAVVAVALALTAGSVSLLRASSKESICLNRLGQVIEASLIYATIDPDENLIPVGPFTYAYPDERRFNAAYAFGGKSGRGSPGFCGEPRDPASSKYGTRCGFGPAARPLNQTLYGDTFPDYMNGTIEQQRSDTRLELEPYICPADSGYAGAHCPDFAESGLSSYDHFGTSFSANVFMTGLSDGRGNLNSTGPYLRPTGTIPDPSRTIGYMENVGRWAWAVRDEPCPFLVGIDPKTPNDTVGGWHGKDWTYNSAFADGHVASIFMHSYSPHEETSYPPYPGGGEGSFAVYQCVMIRGDTWQLDVFPAAPLDTGILNGFNGRQSYAGCVGP